MRLDPESRMLIENYMLAAVEICSKGIYPHQVIGALRPWEALEEECRVILCMLIVRGKLVFDEETRRLHLPERRASA